LPLPNNKSYDLGKSEEEIRRKCTVSYRVNVFARRMPAAVWLAVDIIGSAIKVPHRCGA
jgi:hypothetical protein